MQYGGPTAAYTYRILERGPHSVRELDTERALCEADASGPVSLLELALFGVLCYAFGFVSGAVVIPWLVDRGLFPVRRRER